MSQATDDIQLQVWKDLALSKQLLANEVIKALDLDSNSSAADIKDALNKLVDRANHADTNIAKARAKADESINEMRAKLKMSEHARAKAEGAINDTVAARESAEHALEAGRQANAEALKKAKAELANRERELKAINTALADTPENVVKKLKVLKKQKHDENTARKAAEVQVRTLKKEKKELQDKIDEGAKTLQQTGDLVTAYRELREQSEKACSKLAELLPEGEEAIELPEQDDKLLEGLDMASSNASGDKKDKNKDRKKEAKLKKTA